MDCEHLRCTWAWRVSWFLIHFELRWTFERIPKNFLPKNGFFLSTENDASATVWPNLFDRKSGLIVLKLWLNAAQIILKAIPGTLKRCPKREFAPNNVMRTQIEKHFNCYFFQPVEFCAFHYLCQSDPTFYPPDSLASFESDLAKLLVYLGIIFATV